ncbi:MAG TPA: hypothetical protein VFP64_16440, partial [Pyrinomonadaceae bacterium]|nr:hypothetical protein [Pyrinomonadaceae bacterium]
IFELWERIYKNGRIKTVRADKWNRAHTLIQTGVMSSSKMCLFAAGSDFHSYLKVIASGKTFLPAAIWTIRTSESSYRGNESVAYALSIRKKLPKFPFFNLPDSRLPILSTLQQPKLL